MKVLSVFLCILILVTATLISAFQQPTPWPPRHTHTEIEWSVTSSPQSGQIKDFYYDFPSKNLRVDGSYAFGPAAGKLASIQNYWQNNTLHINSVISLGNMPIQHCVSLDLGFGMMVPSWMNENTMFNGVLWDSRRGFQNATGLNDNTYYNVTWTSNPVGAPFPPFNYFAMEGGAPFKMFAPTMSPTSIVVNEYYNFVPVRSFPADTFALPASCIKKNATHQTHHKDEESMYEAMRRQEYVKDENKLPRMIVEMMIEQHKTQISQFKTMALQKQI